MLSELARSCWGKTGADDDWLPLAGHLLDVAAVAGAVIAREPASTRRLIAADFGVQESHGAQLASAIAGLHDLGKADPAFQGKWPAGRARLEQLGMRWDAIGIEEAVPHSLVTRVALPPLLERIPPFSPGTADNVADAVGAHHGFRATASEVRRAEAWLRGTSDQWGRVREEITDTVFAVTSGRPASNATVPGFRPASFVRLAGLVSLADWIASDLRFFPLGRQLDDPGVFYAASLDRAERALDSIGWHTRGPLLPSKPCFRDFFGFAPRPLQDAVAQLVSEADGPCVLVVEAPMGEGKTEAALYAHTRLAEQEGHRGLYVALPTQATGNSMFSRVRRFLDRAADGRILDLQLVHGASLLNEEWTSLRINGIGEDLQAPGSVVAHEWFTHRKRALVSGHGVGTVDQALMSVLNVRHQFVRLWGLANRTVIIDEVHAYDLYTSGLVNRLVSWLVALGSSVIVMSATLPASRRRLLLQSAGGQPDPAAPPYPRITCASRGAQRSVHVPATARRTLEFAAWPTRISELAPLVARSVADGGNLACIVNTVDRAQRLFTALCETTAGAGSLGFPPVLELFHARFPAGQRQQIETRVIGRYGPGASGRPARSIVVATQVLEQSLDLDFDVMVSDLAPVDLLLQRAGRLHRHPCVERPTSHQAARLHVAGLAPQRLEDICAVSRWVYEDSVVLRTWAALHRRTSLKLPDEIEGLVEEVYDTRCSGSDLGPEFAQLLAAAEREAASRHQQFEALARQAALAAPDCYLEGLVPSSRPADDDDPAIHPTLVARTRLGLPSLTTVPVHRGPWGWSLDRQGRQVIEAGKPPTWETARAIVLHTISVSNRRVVQGLRQVRPPPEWGRHPLLRHVWPIELTDGRGEVGGVVLELHPRLGFCYRRTGQHEEEETE